jgi:Zn-finger nucleic acid-binding protein
VDSFAFDRVVANQEKQMAILALGTAPSTPGSAGSTTSRPTVVYLRCPSCRQLMNRTNFGKRSGVIVDVCKPHGIWFDRDELSAVVAFVKRGGLLEAKKLQLEEMERELARKKDELARDQVFAQTTSAPSGGLKTVHVIADVLSAAIGLLD